MDVPRLTDCPDCCVIDCAVVPVGAEFGACNLSYWANYSLQETAS